MPARRASLPAHPRRPTSNRARPRLRKRGKHVGPVAGRAEARPHHDAPAIACGCPDPPARRPERRAFRAINLPNPEAWSTRCSTALEESEGSAPPLGSAAILPWPMAPCRGNQCRRLAQGLGAQGERSRQVHAGCTNIRLRSARIACQTCSRSPTANPAARSVLSALRPS